jgi:hypothetical protein
MTVYVDADHAHDQVIRTSIIGIHVMPIGWIDKHQKTVESSTCSSMEEKHT